MSSNRDRRIDRLLPTLSAQERAIFVLRQYKSGAEETPAIMSTMPRNQIDAFNRYVRLMNTVNSDLGAALLLIDAQVKQTDTKYAWLMSLLLISDEVEGALHQISRETKDPKVGGAIKRLIARGPGALKVPLGLTSDGKEPLGQSFVRALVTGIRDGLSSHWRELRAIEMVVDEVAEEFGAEDPLRPDTRRVLDDAKATCVKLCHDIQPYADGFELAEPTDEDVELVRGLVASQVNEN
ncbi:MAG: hypothetical protein M3P30_03090 [Chloroflexota bacterium]|nr:hypothetical protein [Chloroflexota bacterium]